LRRKSKSLSTDRQLLGGLYDLYYNNRDLKLLLDLLAQSSGIAPSIRVLSLFDCGFRQKSEIKSLRVTRQVERAKSQCSVYRSDQMSMVSYAIGHLTKRTVFSLSLKMR
jgi:hypothetical protein